MYTFNIFSSCTIRHLQRRLKKSNRALTSAAIRIHVHTEAPALSYLKTPITSSTVRAQWDITADFVKNEEQHLVKSTCRKMEVAILECINCQTQQLYPCTRSSVMPSLKKDSFGRLSNLSAVAIKMNLRTRHFLKTIRKIRKLLNGTSFVSLCHVWQPQQTAQRTCEQRVTLTLNNFNIKITLGPSWVKSMSCAWVLTNAKKSNSLAFEDITALAARLSSSKRTVIMHIVIRIGRQR